MKIYECCYMIIHVIFHVSYALSFIDVYCDDEGTSFMTFVRNRYIIREIMLRRTKDINI
jgi:hypothetical protein